MLPATVGRLGAILLVLVAAPAQLGAQPPERPEGPPGEVFTDTVEVRVVNVEVYVTDGQGRPVTGLGPEDFEVYEDGRRMEISNFYAVSAEPVPGPTAAAGEPEPPEAPSAAPPSPQMPPPPPEERRLHLVVYVDQLDTTAGRRNQVLEGLELFLEERLTLDDQVMVVASYPAFDVLLPFTDDREAVLTTVRNLRKQAPMPGLAQETRQIRSRIERAGNSPDLQLEAAAILNDIRSYSQQAARLLRREILGLRAFVGSLAGLPGRKAILHLSEGLPMRPGEDLYAEWEAAFGTTSSGSGGFGQGRENDLSPELGKLVEVANASGVTFYTLDMASWAGSSVSAESRGMSVLGERLGGPETEALAQANYQAPLQRLAGSTGGVPILNANRPWRVLEDLAPTFDTYYSLGYSAPDRTPGKYHRIEVKVPGRGLRVRHREGYRISSAAQRFEDRTVGALLHHSWQNPLRVFLAVKDPKRKKKQQYLVPVEVKIPLGQIALVPDGRSHRGKVRVRIAYSQDEGRNFGIGDELEVPIVIPDRDLATARTGHFTVSVDVTLERGLSRLMVGVLDELGGEASFLPYDVYTGEG